MRAQSLYVFGLACICLVVAGYGNGCSKLNNRSRNPASNSSLNLGTTKDSVVGIAQDGSGQTYDGKVFRSLLAPGSLCGDGQRTKTSIEFTSTSEPLLKRQDCQDLVRPTVINKGEIGFPPGDGIHIIFQGEVLTDAAAPDSAANHDQASSSNPKLHCVSPLVTLRVASTNYEHHSVEATYTNRLTLSDFETVAIGTAKPALVSSALPLDIHLESPEKRISLRVYNISQMIGDSLRGTLTVTHKKTEKINRYSTYCTWEQ